MLMRIGKKCYLRSVKQQIRTYLCGLLLMLGAVGVGQAQSNKVYHPMIHTLQTIVNDDWLHDDVITLGTDDWVAISFDHFTHDYHRFIYKIVHCNADWTPSDLFEVDYMDGFNNQPIEDYDNSLNTTMLYTHYRLDLPNDDIQFKVSGNYRVEIFLDNGQQTTDEEDNDEDNEDDAAELQAVGHWPLAVGSRDDDNEEDAAELQVKGEGLKVNSQEPRANSQSPTDYIFMPNKEDIFKEMLPKSLKLQVYKILLDSYASEQGARMISMTQATDNATELLKELNISYNKARQSAITNELVEIISGANALNNS